jgi:hypothetical protein
MATAGTIASEPPTEKIIKMKTAANGKSVTTAKHADVPKFRTVSNIRT